MSNTNKKRALQYLWMISICLSFTACKLPALINKTENKTVPVSYNNSQDTTNWAKIRRNDFFTDSNLRSLIDTALVNNQELNIILQEINIGKAEVLSRKGEYLPFVNAQGGAGADKVARYTRSGALEVNTDIAPGKAFPEPLPDFFLTANASWEVDIWRKLRNSRDAANSRYLSSIDGKNFMITLLVSEIANSYYELMALDNKLEILKSNIEIQKNALEIVKLEKNAARVTELAVRKFEAEVLKNQSRQFYIQQEIIETENRINFLVGRSPQPIQRNSQAFPNIIPDTIYAGIPAQLLENRPDIRQAGLELIASKLDIKVAKANFYPSLRITANLGSQSFNPQYFLRMPESMLFALAGDAIGPLINKKAIKAQYYTANAKQIQAVYNYERTILNAYIEVLNQLSMVSNLKKSYDFKEQQVNALTQSITISTYLFKSARADYMEVLMTQRDALESKFELIETKQQQMNAMVNLYRALGGGWN